MKIMNKLIVPVTAGVLLLGGCSSDSTDSKDNTLISSKAGNVTVKDVMDKIGKDQIASTSFSIELNKILADKYKDKVDTKRIDDDIKKEEKQYGGKDQFESMLKQQGMTLDDYKEQKRLSAYQKQLLNDKIKVSDKEIKDDTKKASHILIKVKSDSDKEGLSDKKAKAKAEKIQKEVEKNPNKFDELAKKESMDSASAKKGGSLGYVIKGQMVDKFDKALFKLKEGQISDIVKTEYGYHIIKANKEDDFNKQKSQLKTKIIEQKVQKNPKLLTNAYKDLLKEYNVDYKDSDIKKSVEDTILNPEKLKEQQSSGASSGLSS
ncbi:peptidylprolyl isomerase [Staphylococcus hominis]|uniref:peptidylprolyl isomerase PrsA n=1 Tax=Staphylococcus TaxID=1279 RepID=UPI00019FCD92|nr:MULTISPECIES: foldase protein PrsA [Staphylococcus]AUJ52396.1 peptidylprolyl isomerase [Staphylococcus hominis subsp. hominis]AYY67038.1 peptidylprolyl isomerase [Staphylococcus hominis]EEK11514.1 PPIC-type PPIASE domain protein [Staphylococcus hominis SK119]EHR87897.1 putative foldase protein PrsA [Staphylococcus hominis VCU122]MCC3712241.1 peptidylprolyl isomerase [Staphylococcus hominis]